MENFNWSNFVSKFKKLPRWSRHLLICLAACVGCVVAVATLGGCSLIKASRLQYQLRKEVHSVDSIYYQYPRVSSTYTIDKSRQYSLY